MEFFSFSVDVVVSVLEESAVTAESCLGRGLLVARDCSSSEESTTEVFLLGIFSDDAVKLCKDLSMD